MKSTFIKSFWIILGFFLLPNPFTYGQTAREILEKWESKFRGNTSLIEIKMNIIRPDWNREIAVKTWSKGQDFALILIQEPARDKGTVFLKRGREIWNWIPSIERTVKMPPSMMMQSWMGSDFKNDDLVRESSILNDYTHRIVKEESIDGKLCWQVELIPKPGAPVVWGKVLSWITKSDYLQLKSEFYDEDDVLVNTMLFSNIKKMGGRLIPATMEMIPADDPGNKTILNYISVSYDLPLDDSFFSLQNMTRVK